MERGPVILFDGHCNLCSGSVRFLIRRDPHARFRFASLQGEAARRLCMEAGAPLHAATKPDSIVLIADGRALERSEAALAIAAYLGFPWRLFAFLRIVPRPIRDAAYRFVARNRDRWFGRTDACMVPTPELRARFID
jgi:predicted DCC family thiol-disulfide oxidoreductase YuxK